MKFREVFPVDNDSINKISATVESRIPRGKEVAIVCVGYPAVLGDSVGPLVGYFLKKEGVPNVYGCLDDALTMSNVYERWIEIKEKHKDAYIIGVDAMICKDVGHIIVKNEPVEPGIVIEAKRPVCKIGDLCIAVCVSCIGGILGLIDMKRTRLNLVYNSSRIIAASLCQVLLKK